MADTGAIALLDGVTSVPVARVPRTAGSNDYTHSVETFQFQCADRRWRTAGLVDFDAAGAEIDVVPEDDGAWEPIRDGTLPDSVWRMACDGQRARPPHWDTVKAFVDAGRPGRAN